MKKRTCIIVTLAILLLCIVGGGLVFKYQALATVDDDIICDGVYVDTINISGMTVAEATSAINSYVNELKTKTLTIKVNHNEVITTFGELGYEAEKQNYVEQALLVGKSGNIIKRYKELKDIEKEQLVYELRFTLDNEKLQELVKTECSSYNVPGANATLTRVDGSFVIEDHKIGKKLVEDETIDKIRNYMLNGWDQKDLVVEAVVIDDEPLYTRETLEKVNAVIGTYSTTYATSSSSRAGNLSNGANLINGTVVYPEEVFSCYEYLNPFTTENGYFTAGAYSQGMVIDSIGGGVCQVSSTLYNAAILAELEIVERSPHSMSVGYVPLSRDAAIAGTYKDLKFKNNMDIPIYVEAYTSGRTITFNIYGEDKGTSGRTVRYETVVSSQINPPADVVTEDKTQPITYSKVTQSAHVGYKAELYKIVEQDGVEISRVLFNKSSYAAAPKYITVGTKEEEIIEEKPEEVLEDIDEESSVDSPSEDKKPSKDTSKDAIKDTSKDAIKDTSKDAIKDTSKDTIKDTSKDTIKDTPKDTPKDKPVPSDEDSTEDKSKVGNTLDVKKNDIVDNAADNILDEN